MFARTIVRFAAMLAVCAIALAPQVLTNANLLSSEALRALATLFPDRGHRGPIMAGLIGADEQTGASISKPQRQLADAASRRNEQDAAPASCAGESDKVVLGDRIELIVFERVSLDLSADHAAESVFERRDLSGVFQVGETGELSLPLIGRIPAEGKSLLCIEVEIANRFRRSVGGETAVSANFAARPAVAVRGLVSAPGSYSFVPGMNVGHVLALAGASVSDSGAMTQRDAPIRARLREIDILLAARALERASIEAAMNGARELALEDAERAHLSRLLGSERIKRERAALSAYLATRRMAAEQAAQQVAAARARLDIARSRADLLARQQDEATSRATGLADFRERGLVSMDRIDQVEASLHALQRLRFDADAARVEAELALYAATQEAEAARERTFAELSTRLRDVARGATELSAQRVALEIQLAAAAPHLSDGSLQVVVLRRTSKGVDKMTRGYSDPIRPGDVVIVENDTLSGAALSALLSHEL